ncbi:hypothetical protein AVEN_212381-1 [Araneus ventricosus]|uniref:Uncharacterized protein n=1 Tax=Araneus ventricosus TaxID=182803 RepID=A0A4Y2TUI6_ARAVE|nr:hypothetical protein AVEN_212381-1 [Araneus ventricosus]
MQLNWIEARVGFLGNEAVDNLAKQATKEGTHLHLQTPKCRLEKKILGTSLSKNGNKNVIYVTLESYFYKLLFNLMSSNLEINFLPTSNRAAALKFSTVVGFR